jgi:hypothetical protein
MVYDLLVGKREVTTSCNIGLPKENSIKFICELLVLTPIQPDCESYGIDQDDQSDFGMI